MVDVGAPLISYGETPEAIEPCEGAFDYPSMTTELFLALDALARNTREDAALAASFAAARVIMSRVGVALVGPFLRAAGLSANRGNGVEQGAATRCKNYLYQANINPRADEQLTPEQRDGAVDTLEKNLGLTGQPRFVVEHQNEGRTHWHVVWSRIDTERMGRFRTR